MSLSHTQPTPGALACALALLAVSHGCQTFDAPTPEAPPPVQVHSDEIAPGDTRQPSAGGPTGPARIVSSKYGRAARYSADHGGVAMLVVEGDDIVLAVGPIDEPHPIHNATESFWGVVAVAADVDGLLDLDEPVSLTLDEFAGARWKQDIRVRQLLWYTSGLEAGVWPLTREKPRDHFARALALDAVAPAGARFQFGPSHLAVFGELLRRKLEPDGLDAVAYLTQRILDPIGLTVSDWRRDAAGNPDLAAGASLTAVEWAKFGRLLRDVGRWRGEAIVDPAAMQTCFVGSDVQPSFGLTVWVNPTRPRTTESATLGESPLPDFLMAAGSGNQRMYAIPSLDLVVVRLGRAHRGWRDREFLGLLISDSRTSRDSPREAAPVAKDANSLELDLHLSHLRSTPTGVRSKLASPE
ncbi:MAG: serine hydrolase domain-containing protein [Myxococcota bacterium]